MKITDIITEAASPAQQAAIAISMKKAGKKPRSVDEDLTRRGFLRGLGAAAVAGVAGNALAGSNDPNFVRKVHDQHNAMIEKNPRYAKEHDALGIYLARGIAGASAENNKRWVEKTAQLLQKYGVKVNEGVAEANIQPTSAASRSHIGNLSNPVTNSVVHPSSGKEIGLITMQPTGEYYAQPSSTALATSQGGTFATKDEAHQFIRNAHAKAIKNGTLSDKWLKKQPLPQFAKGQGVAEDTELAEEFDLIESIVEMIAEHNGVDAEVVWADLESLTEDELYVFAVTSDPLMEDWQKANKRDKTDGMSQKAVNAYRRENPGSKLKTAVTTKPSKLKKGGKASKRRKSYCSRSRGQMKMHSISCAKTPDKAICKARRRWNC